MLFHFGMPRCSPTAAVVILAGQPRSRYDGVLNHLPDTTVIVPIADDYAGVVSQRLASERLTLAGLWLQRLKDLLPVQPNEVFPSDELLDHIPALIEEIAAYLEGRTDEEIAANTEVTAKARELGTLRHHQRASVHQLLREYEILADLLETFIIEETERLGLQPSASESFEIMRRLMHSARTLMRTTVETFISEYTTTIRQRDEQIQAFNRMASHELRSPIGTLLFAAASLNQDSVQADPQRVAKVAATIRANAERLSLLVQNLQRLAHLTEPLDVPSQQHVDLVVIVTEVVRQLEGMAASRGVALRVDSDLPALFGDPARLELVMLNLVSNGIKYSDPGKPDSFVEITNADTSPNPGTCTICVRDNGLGIPASDQPTIFEPFFRAHVHLDGEHGVTGSGLGLAIVAECVQALGGSIRCESTPGEGTAFFITVPCHPDRCVPSVT